MKRWSMMAIVAAWMPLLAVAQVEKQVEVTKSYVPTLEKSEKLAIAPDMTDTMQLRPEIDYTITPLSMQTSLTTRPIRPAQLFYWEFNRPLPFYLKAGIGAPLQSELDFYAAMQNPTTGYLLGYVNHTGRYAAIENDFGDRHAAEQMDNRAGVAAGKYLGKRLLEGSVTYAHRLRHRYGAHLPADKVMPSRIGYSDLDAVVRIGDDFQNLTRTNFEVVADAAFRFDHTDPLTEAGRGDESRLGISAKVARAFGERNFSLSAAYRHTEGDGALDRYRQQLVSVGVRYATHHEQYRYEVGADYHYDRFRHRFAVAENYIFPFARFEVDLISDAVKPFAEIDGRLSPNDFSHLSALNPYLETPLWLKRSTAEWEARGGITGHSKRTRFNYRAYVAFALRENQLYWLVPAVDAALPISGVAGWLTPLQGRQTVVSFGGSMHYRPITALQFDVAARFYAYNDENKTLENGLPAIEGEAAVRYEDRKVRIGLKTIVLGAREWSVFEMDQPAAADAVFGTWRAPFTVDLQLEFEWLISAQTALYVEGRNLLCRDLCHLPTMPEYGINGLIGVRIAF